MNYISLFSGAGGLDIGFNKAEFKSKGFVEYWKPAIETMKCNIKDNMIVEDITKITEKDLEGRKAEVIIGGPPCQGFSMAGARKKEDKRNTLFEDYLKVVDYIRPKFCLMENVKGIATMLDRDGNKIIEKIFKGFSERGYEVKAKILNSFNYRVPQKRQRVIFIANNIGVDYEYPEPVIEKLFLKDVLTLGYDEQEELQHIYLDNKKLMKKAFYLKKNQKISSFGSAGKKLDWIAAPTITKTGRYIHPKYNRIISVREAARIQTFPDEWIFKGSIENMYGQIGNAVPVNMAYELAKSIKRYL